MNGSGEIFWRSLQLFFLVIAAEAGVYFREDILAFFTFFPRWFTVFFPVILALAVSIIFYFESKKSDTLKNQFIEIATHKFRTPLSVIGWSADSLETPIDLEQRREEVKKIRISVEKLREIIDTLIGVTAVKDAVFYHFSPVDFRTVFESALKESLKKEMEEKNIRLTLNMPVKMPIIYADNRRIEFVIKNLIENAVKYTPKGGDILIAAEIFPDSIFFSVKDTGIGIEKRNLERIFSSFYRSREAKLSDTEGMGLGLFVSKKIIDKHGGKIWAESGGLGKGATFFIRFQIDKYRQIVA